MPPRILGWSESTRLAEARMEGGILRILCIRKKDVGGSGLEKRRPRRTRRLSLNSRRIDTWMSKQRNEAEKGYTGQGMGGGEVIGFQQKKEQKQRPTKPCCQVACVVTFPEQPGAHAVSPRPHPGCP